MKHRTHSTLANRIPVPPRRKLSPLATIVLSCALAVAVLALLLIGFAPSAGATGAPSPTTTTSGHAPVVVCHNREHNPVVIVVDDNSTHLQGHLKHREQAQLRDLVEGHDGTAAEVRALCVKSDTPTTSTTTTSSSTSSTSTTSSSSSTTSGPPTTSTTTHTRNPVNVKPRHTVQPTGGIKGTVTVKPRHTVDATPAAPVPTVDQPELAHTGAYELKLTGLALLLLLAGAAVKLATRTRRH